MGAADWIATAVAIAVLVFGGGGFWIWVRKLSADIAVLKAWAKLVDKRCDDRRGDMRDLARKIGEVHERVDDLHKCVAEKDSETAKAVGRLEGRMETLLGGSGKVRT